MESKLTVGFLVFVLFGGSIYPAIGQSESVVNNVVINEIDTNPPGDDSKSIVEWVELYNPTDTAIDIGEWSIASTTVLKKTLKIPSNTVIKPGEYILLSYEKLWFPDVSELVELRDKQGNVIDSTPRITDLKNDFTTWQRIYDGYDTDSDGDWKFAFGTIGKSNGKLQTEKEISGPSITLSTDKTSYMFGETASISGKISEQKFIVKPYFQPEQIKITISGVNGFYNKKITLYPDLNLSYKTGIVLNKVLGVVEGDYTVTAQYGDAIETAKFTVGTSVMQSEEKKETTLSIITDNGAYLPGQFVKIIANTDDIIPLVGLKYKVINPLKQTAFSGTLYPNTKGEFSGSVFMSTVKPAYGTYTIISDYDTKHAETTFDLVEDIKESKIISLKTDKPVYGLGEKVSVTGRVNNLWIPTLDLEVLQIGSLKSAEQIRQGGANTLQSPLKILDMVRLEGDSTFKYEFTIPNGLSKLGDYRLTVSKEIGSAQVSFKVSENPDEAIINTEPFKLTTDKEFYDAGEKLVISGNISELKARSTYEATSVEITFKNSDGKDVVFLGCQDAGGKKALCTTTTKFSLTGIPNTVGDFRSEIVLTKELFKPGTYTVKASYDQNRYTASTQFTINKSVVIGVNDILVNLDKKVYGLGETVQLKGQVSNVFSEKNLKITITKPNGSTERHGVVISNAAFSWSWKTPTSEKLGVLANNERTLTSSVFGTYKIIVASERDETVVFFTLVESLDDLVSDQPLVVKTNKAIYNVGEKLEVSGKTTKRPQATSGQIPERVQILVKAQSGKTMYESFIHPDTSGSFKQSFDLQPTIFKEGTYRVIVSYFALSDEIKFEVNNSFTVGGGEPLAIIMELDKEEYYPGDTVVAKGKTNKLIYLDKVEMTVIKEDPSRKTCANFYCGKGVPVKTVKPDQTGAFTYEYKIPNSSQSIGTYMLSADTDFGSTPQFFTVVERPAEMEKPEIIEPTEEKVTKKLIEKFNSISDSSIPISVGSKSDEENVFPRVIQGSLLTSIRGAESLVNIKLVSESGVCVIGPDADCKISKSTRAPGKINETIEVDGISYNVIYTGPDAKLEKFSIVPELSDQIIPDSIWTVEIIKQDQPSKFYYKVSYIPVE